MKACVFTLGCKVNDVESGSIIRGLKELGWEVTRALEKADLYVFNTCAVTAEAERKSRQAIGKAKKLSPTAKIVVYGCAAEKNPQAFLEKGAFCAGGTMGKQRVLEIAKSNFDERFCGVQVQALDKNYEEMLTPECLKTRNFVKIQDGCNRFCCYCVIPYLRGRSRSRSLQSAAEEILLSTAKETVITGIDISDYKDGDNDLTDLLCAVKDAKTRIRLGSIEESLITPRFLAAAKGVRDFAPQFHLSLQSGSSSVLRSMNRKYTREEYLKKCEMIYAAFPDAAITTDIIVGFPTETEEDFLQSLSIVEEAGFSQIHAFPYSPREGTNAWKKHKELPFDVKKERLDRLLAAGAKQKKKYAEKFFGKVLSIVPERCKAGVWEGYSQNYIRVYAKGDKGVPPTHVRVEEHYLDGVIGEIVD